MANDQLFPTESKITEIRDSDGFFEIDLEASPLPSTDIRNKNNSRVQKPIIDNCSEIEVSNFDLRKYRAWIGARNLHIS